MRFEAGIEGDWTVTGGFERIRFYLWDYASDRSLITWEPTSRIGKALLALMVRRPS